MFSHRLPARPGIGSAAYATGGGVVQRRRGGCYVSRGEKRPTEAGRYGEGDGVALVAVPLTGLALAMSGFAAMGMEILWFRHLSILLGGFRAVFSMLLTVILIGIGAGSLMSGFVFRRTTRAEEWFMAVQSLFVVSTLAGLAAASASSIESAVMTGRGGQSVSELWFNARPILLEAGLPALLMGFGFPVANAIVQRSEHAVARSAGALYLANTCGAVCGSLAAGFLLLPTIGMQATATLLTAVAGLAVVPVYFTSHRPRALTFSLITSGSAVLVWALLPPAYVVARAALPLEHERVVARSEDLTEVIAVADVPGGERTLLTNGHPMSSTSWLSQRYMRALAHTASVDRQAGDGPRHRFRRRQLDARGDPPSFDHARRCGGSFARDSRACGLLQRRESRCAERPSRDRVRQRRAAPSADAASGHIRTDHAGAAANYICRRGSVVFDRVLRAGQNAAHGEGLHQPVASGLSGACGDDPGDDPRIHRYLSARGADLGRRSRPAAHRHERAASRDRSRAADADAGERSGRAPGSPAVVARHGA